jgi:SpoVK/Ycf46/Vps4 family AAA+-type ATPase
MFMHNSCPLACSHLHQVPAPDVDARLAILQVHLRSTPCHADVSLSELATNATAGFTGAEVSACCQEAAFAALREHFQQKGEKGEMEPALTADSGHKKHKERSDGANKVNGEDSDGSEGPVVCMRHLLAAASRTAPLLADPVAAARYADDFSLNK